MAFEKKREREKARKGSVAQWGTYPYDISLPKTGEIIWLANLLRIQEAKI